MWNAAVMLQLPDVYGSIGTMTRLLEHSVAQSTEYRFLLKKIGHGSKSFLVCILKSSPIFCPRELNCKNMYSVGFVTLL